MKIISKFTAYPNKVRKVYKPLKDLKPEGFFYVVEKSF